MPAASPYKRIILKLSGESFAAPGQRGISMTEVVDIAAQTQRAARLGVQIAIVIGGGNILRGAQFTAGNSSIQEATAHYMGMLATVINGLALQDALESLGADTRLMSAIRMDGVAEPYIRRRARRELDYNTVRERNLRVMDQTAIALCMEHNMRILVFNFHSEGNIERAVRGER